MTTISVLSLNVPQLPDNDIAFLNADAWNNYWLQGEFTANINIATSGDYGLVKQASTTVYVDPGVIVDAAFTFNDTLGAPHLVVDQATYDSLKAQVAALVLAVKQMRTAMVTAGLITNGQ